VHIAVFVTVISEVLLDVIMIQGRETNLSFCYFLLFIIAMGHVCRVSERVLRQSLVSFFPLPLVGVLNKLFSGLFSVWSYFPLLDSLFSLFFLDCKRTSTFVPPRLTISSPARHFHWQPLVVELPLSFFFLLLRGSFAFIFGMEFSSQAPNCGPFSFCPALLSSNSSL